MLAEIPMVNKGKNQSQNSVSIWKSLKPLTIEDLISNSDNEVIIDEGNTEFKVMKTFNSNKSGQFRVGTSEMEGIGRKVLVD